MDQRELERIANAWYTERRGHVHGNTRAWSDLTADERTNIVNEVENVVDLMKETWQWPVSQ